MSFPEQSGQIERVCAVYALFGIQQFIAGRAPSEVLGVLSNSLNEIESGTRPAMFEPDSRPRKRPNDSVMLQQVKGALAGSARLKQSEGMPREGAVNWIARNIAPELQRKISKKPLTGRTIREWLERYGGRRPPDNPGGKAFEVWSRACGSELTNAKFRELTARLAQALPARAGK